MSAGDSLGCIDDASYVGPDLDSSFLDYGLSGPLTCAKIAQILPLNLGGFADCGGTSFTGWAGNDFNLICPVSCSRCPSNFNSATPIDTTASGFSIVKRNVIGMDERVTGLVCGLSCAWGDVRTVQPRMCDRAPMRLSV